MTMELVTEAPLATAPRPRRMASVGDPFSPVFEARCGELAVDDLDPAAFPDPVVFVARDVWQERARAEYRALQEVSRWIGELALAGEAPQILAVGSHRLDAQMRRVAACAAVTTQLGGTPILPDPSEPHGGPAGVVDRALATAIALGVDETLAVANVEDVRARCTTPAVLRVLEAMVPDEDDGEELVWAYVAHALERGGRATRAAARDHVEAALRPHRERIAKVLDRLPPRDRHPDRHADRELVALGLVSDARQALVGHAAIERRVLARLRTLELA